MSESLSSGKALQMTTDAPPFDPAVDFINQEVFSYASKEGQGNAYQAVSQSMAQTVQNAAFGLQNMIALTNATTAVFMKKAAEAPTPAERAEWLSAIVQLQTPLEAQKTFVGDVGEMASTVVKEFPNGTS